MNGQYQLDFKSSKRLEDAMKQIPEQSEEIVNRVLKTKGTKQMIQAIISFIPVSKVNKNHAKFSSPLTFQMQNLGFRVFTKGGAANIKGSFGYLVFPDEGRGSSNPIAHNFFEKGADSVSDVILDQTIDALIEQSNKILGGI